MIVFYLVMIFLNRILVISSAIGGYIAFKHTYLRTSEKDLKVNVYRLLPLRSFSRMWGRIATLKLKGFTKKPLLSAYAKFYKVNLGEAKFKNLEYYSSFANFFERDIDESCRTIDDSMPIISPCDGTITHYGVVDAGESSINVKGFKCSLGTLIGNDLVEKYKLKSKKLYYITLYLDPGDYHGIHSPGKWDIFERRHIPGELFSVSPFTTRMIPKTFSLNERVVYSGNYEKGFLSMVAIGATNVGSIKFYGDEKLLTNSPLETSKSPFSDKSFKSSTESEESNFCVSMGEKIGHFSMGSSVAIFFESDPNLQFHEGLKTKKIKYGESFAKI